MIGMPLPERQEAAGLVSELRDAAKHWSLGLYCWQMSTKLSGTATSHGMYKV